MNYSPDILLTPVAYGLYFVATLARIIWLSRQSVSNIKLISALHIVATPIEVALLYMWMWGLGIFQSAIVFVPSLFIVLMLLTPLYLWIFRKEPKPFRLAMVSGLILPILVLFLVLLRS